MVKHLPAMQETQVQSLGQENPREKEMATHSSILAWRISWTEEPGGLQSMGLQRVSTTDLTHTRSYEISADMNCKPPMAGSVLNVVPHTVHPPHCPSGKDPCPCREEVKWRHRDVRYLTPGLRHPRPGITSTE